MGIITSNPYYGTQVNEAHVGLICNYGSGTPSDVYDSTFSVQSPLGGSSITYSNILGSIQLPQRIQDFGQTAVGNLTGDVSVSFDLTGSSASGFVVKQEINQGSQDYTINLLGSSQGPFAVESDVTSILSLGQVVITLDYTFPGPEQVGSVIVTCNKPNAVLDSVIGVSGSFVSSSGYRPPLPALSLDQKATVADVPMVCQDEDNTANTYDDFGFSVNGVLSLSPSGSFNISNVQTFVTIPGSIIEQFSQAGETAIRFQYGKTFAGTDQQKPNLNLIPVNGDGFNDWARGTTTEVGPRLPFDTYVKVEKGANQDLVIPLPSAGSETVGPFTAQGNFAMVVQGFNGFVAGYDLNSFEATGHINLNCLAAASSRIFSIHSA